MSDLYVDLRSLCKQITIDKRLLEILSEIDTDKHVEFTRSSISNNLKELRLIGRFLLCKLKGRDSSEEKQAVDDYLKLHPTIGI